MKAVVYTRYGSPDVIRVTEVEKPAPKDDEVLVKVHAASINAYDWHMLTADIFLVRLDGGLLKPKYTSLGADIAGRIETVGKEIKQLKPGDEVFGQGRGGRGGFAEYVCARETALVLKPTRMKFEEGAAIPMAGLTALQGLRDHGRIQAGQKVLVNGAGGGVGSFAVQIAKSYGAEVTAVCSTQNLDMARSIGADHVIDYTRQDFTQRGERFDLIFAANGYHSIFAYRRALASQGVYVMAGGDPGQLIQGLVLGPRLSKPGGQKLGAFMAKINQTDMAYLGELFETGKVRPVIDRCFPLSEAAEALRYVGRHHARGKVVIMPSAST